MKSILFLREKVGNDERKFGSATEYFPATVVLESGLQVPALFTLSQVDEATTRGELNPEDVPEASWWVRFTGWFR